MQENRVMLIVQSILSFIAIAAVIGLGYYESVSGEAISDYVYWILGAAVFGLNANDIVAIITLLKKKP